MANEMGHVKLAQFYRLLASRPKKKKYEFINQIDIDYSIPDKSESIKTMEKILSGYTALHISVMKSDLGITLELISRGASVLKQGTFDKWTPLHLALYNTKIQQQMLWNISGILKGHSLIDNLLTAHVNTGNSFNPVCQENLSHLHMACMFNHIKAVRFLTSKNPVNQVTSDNSHWPGYTALHFAVRYSSTQAAEILIRKGADVHLKDSTGMSPLQLMINRVIDLTDSLTFRKPLDCSLIEKEDILLHELELKAEVEAIKQIIEYTLMLIDDVDYTDHKGLTIFYAACVQDELSIFHRFLEKIANVNIPLDSDFPFWPGWTALHFAALTNIKTLKLLVEHGADLNIKNTAGETALDFCLKKYPPIVIYDILSLNQEYKNVLFTDGTTKLLDVIQLMSDCDEFYKFLLRIDNANITVSPDSPIWPGYSLLHVAVRMNEIPNRILFHDDSALGIFYCFEDFQKVANSQVTTFWNILYLCLWKGCRLTMKNVDGLTPVQLAFHLHKSAVVADLMKYCKEDVVDSNGLSHFHIACVLDLYSRMKLCRRAVNANSPVLHGFEWHNDKKDKPCITKVNANSTPLHIAVIFKNGKLIGDLLWNGADVYAKDALGLTPLHLSMMSTKSISQILLTNALNLVDTNFDGLSYLHVAAFANDDLTIRKLLEQGAQIDFIFQDCTSKNCLSDFIGNTALYVAVKVNSEKAVRELILAGAKIDMENPFDKYDTALEYITKNISSDLVKYFIIGLKRDDRKIFANGITALHVACSRFDLKWTKQLLEMGVNPNAQMCDEEDYHGLWKGYTPLHVLISQIPVSEDDHSNLLDMLQLLLDCGADGLIENRNGCTPIMMAYDKFYEASMEGEEIDENSSSFLCSASTVNMLYNNNKKFDFNPANKDGFTLFHLACMKNDVKGVQRFLDNGVDVNFATDYFGKHKGHTPLHVALSYSAVQVARLLIKNGADIKAEDADGNTPMHLAVTWSVMEDILLVRSMLRNGANVNARNLCNQTPIDCHLKSRNIASHILEYLYDIGSKADMSVEGLIGLAMQNALANDDRLIFPMLIEIFHLKNAIKNGFRAIHSLVSVASDGELKKSVYLECIERFLEMGCGIDEQDEEGKTALHKAVQYHNHEATEVLLSLGADVNIIDKNNRTPFTAIIRQLQDTDPNCKFRQVIASTARAVAKQVWKIDFLQLYMNKNNQDFYEQFVEKMYRGHTREQKFQQELTMMNGIKICRSFSLGDFMAELKTVAFYPKMLMWQRQIVDYFFSCTEEILESFPHLSGILLMQYRKAKARRGLIEESKIKMNFSWPIDHLPDLCSTKIFSYFTNDELKILIEEKENISNPCKRRKLN